MDPRTGEILHQQIYLTSAWAKIGRQDVQKYLRATTELKTGGLSQKASPKLISLAGFQADSFCDLDLNTMVRQTLSDSLSGALDIEKVKKVSADLIREVVAHEVGHTIGLRHNFAGSLSANYSLEQREQLFKDYLSSGSAKDDLVTSSSVMDYQFALESMMNGDQIARGRPVADYDAKAIQTLYLGKQFEPSALPLFCTDSDVSVYLDCRPYDAGNSFVSWIKYSGRNFLKSQPESILQKFIDAKVPLFGGYPIAVSEVELFPRSESIYALDLEPEFLSLLNKDARLLSIERSFPSITSLNRAEVRAKLVDFISADLARNGGFESVLLDASDKTVDALQAKFSALLDDPKVIRGKTESGKSYEFSADEIVMMKTMARHFFLRLKEEMIKSEVNILAGDSVLTDIDGGTEPTVVIDGKPIASSKEKFDENPLATQYAAFLLKKMNEYAFATDGEAKVFKFNSTSAWVDASTAPPDSARSDSKTFTLLKFKYPLNVRIKAAKFLDADRSMQLDWAFAERIAAKKTLKTIIDTALPGVKLKDIETYQNDPQDIIKWVLEISKVQDALD
jgi:hypothetical protein